MSAPVPTLDDIDTNAHNLSQLLDLLVENVMNVTYPASRSDLTRAAALSMIARDMAAAMVTDFDIAHRNILAELGQAKAARAAA